MATDNKDIKFLKEELETVKKEYSEVANELKKPNLEKDKKDSLNMSLQNFKHKYLDIRAWIKQEELIFKFQLQLNSLEQKTKDYWIFLIDGEVPNETTYFSSNSLDEIKSQYEQYLKDVIFVTDQNDGKPSLGNLNQHCIALFKKIGKEYQRTTLNKL